MIVSISESLLLLLLTLTIFSISNAWLGSFIMSFPMDVSSFGWLAVLFTYTLPFEYRRMSTLPASSIFILTPCKNDINWEDTIRNRCGKKTKSKFNSYYQSSPIIRFWLVGKSVRVINTNGQWRRIVSIEERDPGLVCSGVGPKL